MNTVQDKRESLGDRRMTISHPGSSISHPQYPPVPPAYNSVQPGSRASWAGYSSGYNDTEASYFKGGSIGGQDARDDYHHSPMHGSYHPTGNVDYRNSNHDEMYRDGSYSSEYLQQDSHNDYYGLRNPGVGVHGHCNGVQDPTSMMITTNKHRNNSISSNASQSSSSSLSQANKHPCKFPTCGWSFKRFEHLKRHMLVHTKERPFVCDFAGCDKSFSRSDNFSAHLRTHTKKAIHMRRFDHQMAMIDPIRTNFGNGPSPNMTSGPFSDVPGSAVEHKGLVGGAASVGAVDHTHHRHSIAGYPSFSAPRSPLQSQGDYSQGLSSGHMNQGSNSAGRPARNSYCCPSYEQPELKSSVSSSFSLPLAHHRHSPTGMHPLDSPTTDGLNSIVPKFNTIKLDLKAVPNNPDEAHLHNQSSQRSAPSSHRREYDDECGTNQSHQHHLSNGQNPYGPRYGSPDRIGASGIKSPSRPDSPALHGSYGGPTTAAEDRMHEREHDYDQQQQQGRQSSLTGYENSNSNSHSHPNGESPTLTP
ncbi:hypothetical protein BGZ65_008790, partial [Modicella reniformis]